MTVYLNRDDLGGGGGVVDVSNLTYRQLITYYRKHQLQATEHWLKRMESLFDKAVNDLIARLSADDLNGLAYLHDLTEIFDAFRQDYAAHLNYGMLDLAQLAADREAAIIKKFGQKLDPRLIRSMQTSELLSTGAELNVQFGTVALTAVQNTATRVLSDGFKLSDRLYTMDATMKQTVQDAIASGFMKQQTSVEMAKDLRPLLTASGASTPRYQAMRIARTEIVTSHREAHILSSIDPTTDEQKDWIAGVGWALSLSHPEADICDVWAADDEHGLGPGVYLSSDVPTDHPHGLCWTYTVIKGIDIDPPAKIPDTENVPASQAEYYAAKHEDPASVRWVAANGDQTNAE